MTTDFTPASIHGIVDAATARFRLTPGDVEIAEWDRDSAINGVAAETVVAGLEDPYGRPIPETRPALLRVISLDVVLCLQRCHPISNAPIYSDAELDIVLRWMRGTLLPELMADPRKVKTLLDAALLKRIFADAVAESRRAP